LLLLTGLVAALVLAALVTRPFNMFYRRYVEALVTEINLQAMRGTEHMGNAIRLANLLFGVNRAGGSPGRASRVQKGDPLGGRRGVMGDEVTRLGDLRHSSEHFLSS
jgi:hypothetical protein